MVVFSCFFTRDIVRSNLVRNAESVYSFARTQLESDLREPRVMLLGFSQTIRGMLLRGTSPDILSSYINDITDYFHLNGSRITSAVVTYGYFEIFDEPVFICSIGDMPDDYEPRERPWYIAARADCGAIVETIPYRSALFEKTVIAFARCIHDEDDACIGVVGVNIYTEDIGRNVVEIALEQGGYGMLLSQDLELIAHTNTEFIGINAKDPTVPLVVFIDELMAGQDILERPMINWKGESTIAFFRQLDNGWYLGLLTPEKPFYQSLSNMAATLIILGVTFAMILIGILIHIDMARNKSDRESRHKSAFLANMSHEIRTPMNAIIGMTTIGKTSRDYDRKDYCFSKIEDASNHLLGVINDILDMSKIESNKFDLSPSEFDFEKMFQRAVNIVNFRVDEKRQNFTVYIDQTIPKMLFGDEQRIVQVITNLLGNAIKFTPENGSINLDARFIEETNGLCTIQISVADTGIGITPEQQARVFSSFEQAESSTTRKYGGTGLGLAISKSIVERMGGNIWICSEIDKGTTFAFTIQVKRGYTSCQGLLSPDVHLDNVRIMVVDDDKDILDYFMEISREFKVNCDTALSGEEAIRLVEQHGHYHIYFVDWKMPGMDGIQLTAELKAHNEPVKSIVIMITAAEWTVIEKEAREAGVDKFLSKPLFPSHIADVINEALGINHKQIKESQTNVNGVFVGRCILLTEDVEINREIVKALLEPTGIEIDCAENGLEAVRMFNESPGKYDLILMDVQMPEMDGYEATRRIRSSGVPEAKVIPIIAITANVFREDVERCLEAGMDNHVGKPLDFNEVLDRLKMYICR